MADHGNSMSPAPRPGHDDHPPQTPIRTVNQCVACGALTMLSRCPNCDGQAVPAGSQSIGKAQQHQQPQSGAGSGGTPKTSMIGRPAFSPAAHNVVSRSASIVEPTVASTPKQSVPMFIPAPGSGIPGAPGQQQPASRSPSVGARPTNAAHHTPGHVTGQPVAIARHPSASPRSASPNTTMGGGSGGGGGHYAHPSEATAAQLRREVQRLSTELQKRQSEVDGLQREVHTTKASSRHELQELWQTVRKQNDTLEGSRSAESELRAMKLKYEEACAERDHLRQRADRTEQSTSSAISRTAHEAEELRSALHRKQLELVDVEHAAEAAKRQTREAESLLQQNKVRVQQAAQEVVELQRQIEGQRREDHATIAGLRKDVDRLEGDLLTAREQYGRAQHEFETLQRQWNDATRQHEREQAMLKRATDDARRAEELNDELKTRLASIDQELRDARSEIRRAQTEAETRASERVFAHEQEADEKVSQLRRQIGEAQAAARRAEADRVSSDRAREAAEEIQRVQRAEIDAARREVEDAERTRKSVLADLEDQTRLVADMRRALDDAKRTERATHDASLRATESSADLERTATNAKREAEKTATKLRVAQEDVTRLEAELEDTKRKLTEALVDVSRCKGELDHASLREMSTADRRADDVREVESAKLREAHRTADDLRAELMKSNESMTRQTSVHAASIAELRTQFTTMTIERDSLRSEVDRLKSYSPSRTVDERDVLRSKAEASAREAERAAALQRETQVHADQVRRDLTEARTRIDDLTLAADENRAFLGDMREIVVGAGSVNPHHAKVSSSSSAPAHADLLASVHSIVQVAKRADETTRHLEDKVENAITSLDSKMSEVTKQRDVARREASASASRIRELEQQLESALKTTNQRVQDVYDELQAERDSLEQDIMAARRGQAKERDERVKSVEDLKNQLRHVTGERDAIHRELQQVHSDLEDARVAASDAAKSLNSAKHDAATQQALAAAAEERSRDARKALAAAQEDRESLTQELLSMRAAAGSENQELTARLDDIKSKYAKETETLKATVRVEREKLLKEIEATHAANAKSSDLEMSNEALKAERERLTKELDLARQFQTSRLDDFHRNVDTITQERDSFKREKEAALQRVEAAQHDLQVMRNDKATLELALRDAARERDTANRQLSNVQQERDGALRFVSMSQQQQQQHQQQHQPSSVTPANPPAAYTSVYNGGEPSRHASPAPRHNGHGAQPSNANMSAALRANFREEQHDAAPPFMMHAGGSRRTSPNRATTPRSTSAVNKGEALPLSAYRRR